MKRLLVVAVIALMVGATLGAASGNVREAEPGNFGPLLEDGRGGAIELCSPGEEVESYSEIHDFHETPSAAAQALVDSIRQAASPENPELADLDPEFRAEILNWLREGFGPAASLTVGQETRLEDGGSLFVRSIDDRSDVYIAVAAEGNRFHVEHAEICASAILEPDHWRYAPESIREQREAGKEGDPNEN